MPKPKISTIPGYPSAPHCSSYIAPNEVVGADGVKIGVRENEDRVFHCMYPDNKAELYMVLDGHDGTNACDFVKEFLPGELFNRLGGTQGKPEEVRRAIMDTFLETEKRYFLSMDHLLTQKLTLQFELGELSALDAAKRYPNQVEQIERLNRQIRGGTSVVIALVFFGYLYVANVGDSRAVLCQQENPVAPIRVRQLSEDHTLANEREVARLVALGLSRNWLQQRGRLGPCEITRCIGDYRIKGGYSEMVEIRGASREPGTAEPYIAMPLALRDLSKGFLLLMSDGLYKAYQCGRFHPDHLGHLVAQEMRGLHPSNFADVALNVTNSVRATFRGYCMEKGTMETSDDMSLVVRNFGFEMGMDMQYQRTVSVPMHRVGMGTSAVTPTTAPVLANDNPQFRWGYNSGTSGGFGPPHPLHTPATPLHYDAHYGSHSNATLRRHPADPSLGSPTTMHLSSSLSSLQLGELMHPPANSMFESGSSAQLGKMGMGGHYGHSSSSVWQPHPFAPGESYSGMGQHVPHPPPPSPNPPAANVGTMHAGSGVTPRSPGNVVVGSTVPPPAGNSPSASKTPAPEVQSGDLLSCNYYNRTLTRQDGAGIESPLDDGDGGDNGDGGDDDGGDDDGDNGDGSDAASGVIVFESEVEEETSNDGKIKPYISFDTSIPADLSFDML